MLDLLFAYKTADGEVGSLELAGITEQYGPLFASVDGDVPGGLLDAEDVAELTDLLEPNSSIAVICWENTWAAPFLSALEGSGAVLLDQARIPREAVLAALASATRAEETSWDFLGMMARTAVVAGTATAVSDRVSRRQQAK